MWNLNTRPQDQSSFAVSGPCPTRSGEKTVTSAISSRFETGEDWPTLLLPRGSSAFTPVTPCHHLSFFFVIASQDYRILSKIVVHWSTRQSSQSIQSILGLSLVCSAFFLVFVLEGTSRSIGNDRYWHHDGNQGCNRGLGDLSSSLLAIRSQHFIYKWILRSQHAQCIHWYSMENNSIYQRKWQGNANWTPSTLIWTTVFSILFRYFQNLLWLKWVNPLNSRDSLAALQTSMIFYDFCVLERANSRFLRRIQT